MKNPHSSVRYSVISPGRGLRRLRRARPGLVRHRCRRDGSNGSSCAAACSAASSARNSRSAFSRVVGREIAHVDVDGYEAVLRPRVDREVRFGEQHRSRDTLRRELVERIADDRQARRRRVASRQSARSASARVNSGVSAGQPYHSPNRWIPSISRPLCKKKPRRRFVTGEKGVRAIAKIRRRLNADLQLLHRRPPGAIEFQVFARRFRRPRHAHLPRAFFPTSIHRRSHDRRNLRRFRRRDRPRRSPTRSARSRWMRWRRRNRGIPGMPMGMAEIALALWRRPSAPPSGASAVAGSRSLRAVERPRLDAALRAAAPDRLRPADRRAEALPPAALEDARAPGARRDARRRDHDGAARTGARQRGRHGARGTAARRASSTARATRSSITTRTSFVGDGCLMEGISHEAASLAGTWGLGKLDRALRRQRHLDRRRDQGLVHRRHAAALRGLRLARAAETSTGTTSPRSTRRSPRRSATARSTAGRSSSAASTVIGKGAPTKAGTAEAHGAALGEKEVAATRVALGWTHPPFVIPDAVVRRRGTRASAARRSSRHGRSASPRIARRIPSSPREFSRRMAGELPASWHETRGGARRRRRREGGQRRDAQGVAAGARGARAGAAGAPRRLGRPHGLGVHQLVGQQGGRRGPSPGNYLHFGVREFAMSAIANGLALHGGFIPYVGTFLTFSDYARNAVRMAALMKLRVDLRLHARLDRPRRGRPDAPGGRAHGEPAPHSRPRRLASRRHDRDRRRVGRGDRARTTAPPRSSSRGRTSRSSRATPRSDRRHPPRRLRARRLERRGATTAS